MSILNYLRNKSAPYILSVGLASSLLTGCKQVKTEISDVLHEDATVVTRIYTPSTHEPSVYLRIGGSGGVSVIGADGSVVTSMDGLIFDSSEVPEKYGAVFRCQHGTFTSQGSDKRHEDLYNKLQEGQEVDITYKEIYRATYDDIDGDGKKDLVERVLTGFDFLDAQPKKN